MVRTESFLYLFTTIFQAVQSHNLTQTFLQELEQYIESGSIACMTEEVLFLIIKHYLGE